MQRTKLIGILLIFGALGVFIPYTVLTITFDYPDILRMDPATILTRFHAGGATLIFTWFAFAIMALPLLAAYVLIGQLLENRVYYARVATTFGIISGIVQVIGLLRWTFVVPVIAEKFVQSSGEATKESAIMTFVAFHQFGGVLLGEHIGQLFTIIWTILIARAFAKTSLFPKWITWFGYMAAAIYLLAQTELFETVIPGFPVIGIAGLIGSTLWLIWLVIVGVSFLRSERKS